MDSKEANMACDLIHESMVTKQMMYSLNFSFKNVDNLLTLNVACFYYVLVKYNLTTVK